MYCQFWKSNISRIISNLINLIGMFVNNSKMNSKLPPTLPRSNNIKHTWSLVIDCGKCCHSLRQAMLGRDFFLRNKYSCVLGGRHGKRESGMKY
jgi:hypothetical protein